MVLDDGGYERGLTRLMLPSPKHPVKCGQRQSLIDSRPNLPGRMPAAASGKKKLSSDLRKSFTNRGKSRNF